MTDQPLTDQPVTDLSPTDVARRYFAAWQAGDAEQARPLMHPDVAFFGALGATAGVDETVSGLAGMFAATRHVEVVRRWADGPDVITWFDLDAGGGPMAVVNWSHVEDGTIRRIRVTFDPRPMLS